MSTDLNNHHQNTVDAIFAHPASGNVEWRQVISLIEAIGSATVEHNGKLKITVGPETEVIEPPRDKDIDHQMIVDLRRMLTVAGYGPQR
jgi:hypothetical protein